MGEGIANVAMFNKAVPGSPDRSRVRQIRELMCLTTPGASMQIETKHPRILTVSLHESMKRAIHRG